MKGSRPISSCITLLLLLAVSALCYHRDAQFYLINCLFAKNRTDSAIYAVPTANPILWGHRVYYYNCLRKGTDYKWYADNLNKNV